MKNEKLIAWFAFGIVAFFWGTTFFAIRIGVQSFPPMLMAGFRHSAGGILICLYFFLKGYKLPNFSSIKVSFITGMFMLVGGNGLVTWAELYISSGLAALICSLTPIWIVVLNIVVNRNEKFSLLAASGFIICLAAQFLIFNDNLADFTNSKFTYGIIAVMVANILWAIGMIYSKKQKVDVHPLFGTGLQMLCGGIVLDIIGTLRGEWSEMHPTMNSVWALAYLLVFGSIISYSAFMYIIKKLPTSIVSTYSYLNTIVAVILGWLFLAEKLNFIMGIAVVLTIAGVWMVNMSLKKESL